MALHNEQDQSNAETIVKKPLYVLAILLSGCVTETTRVVYVEEATRPERHGQPTASVGVYIEPTLFQPAPVRIAWAPPPMLVEVPPPQPNVGAVWIGGYWVWQGNWIWAHGRWAPPPRPEYHWVHPYYEHREGAVIFINGFWAASGVRFVAPALGVTISLAVPLPGVSAGPRPIGPEGVFVPPPPGSHAGLIVPAPVGTAPAVVTSAPPVVSVGMRITNNYSVSNTTVINNSTTINNVTIVAPASATATGQAVNAAVPAQAHLAAALKPVVQAHAPDPISPKPNPAYLPGAAPATLPPAQPVHATPPETREVTTHPPRPQDPPPTGSHPDNESGARLQPRPSDHPVATSQPQNGARLVNVEAAGGEQRKSPGEHSQLQQQASQPKGAATVSRSPTTAVVERDDERKKHEEAQNKHIEDRKKLEGMKKEEEPEHLKREGANKIEQGENRPK